MTATATALPTERELQDVLSHVMDANEKLGDMTRSLFTFIVEADENDGEGERPSFEDVGRLVHFAHQLAWFARWQVEEVEKVRLAASGDLGELASMGALSSGPQFTESGQPTGVHRA